MKEDLVFLRERWLPLDKSFSDEQRLAFDRAVDAAMAKTDTRTLPDFVLDIMEAVAIPRNGHTAALVGRMLGELPIRLWWFADELRIVSVHPAIADLLGARIEKLGSLDSREALARVRPFISGTDQRRLYLSAVYLRNPAVLNRIGAAPAASKVTTTLTLRDGTHRVVDLGPTRDPDPGDRHTPFFDGYSVLIPDAAAMPGRWPHVLDAIKDRPLTYAPETDLSTAWIGPDGAILYLRSNRIVSAGVPSLEQKLLFGVIQDQVVAKKPRYVVVDLRMNNGGNLFNTILFARALPRLVPPEGRIFVLVGRGTFSAALATAAMMKGNAADRVVLAGEDMGDNGRFWAEGDKVTLPHSGLEVTFARLLEDWQAGCTDADRCYWPAVAFGPRIASLAPDMKITLRFEDYAAGRDPVLEAVIAATR